MNTLIVDDDATSRLLLEATLRKLGRKARVAASGAEALTVFENGSVRLLISDMLMPGVNGLELCARIRAAHRSQYTYIILLTSVTGKCGYLEGMKAGADDFMTKPFDEELLATRLVVAERILSLQSQVKQLTGLLPICALCKKVRDDQDYWQDVESYVTEHTDAQFTHGYCPDCFRKVMREIEEDTVETPDSARVEQTGKSPASA